MTPTTDDKPYFFNFARWDDLEEAKRQIDAPVSVVQGNPTMLFSQLFFSLLASALLLGAPLLLQPGPTTGGMWQVWQLNVRSVPSA